MLPIEGVGSIPVGQLRSHTPCSTAKNKNKKKKKKKPEQSLLLFLLTLILVLRLYIKTLILKKSEEMFPNIGSKDHDCGPHCLGDTTVCPKKWKKKQVRKNNLKVLVLSLYSLQKSV